MVKQAPILPRVALKTLYGYDGDDHIVLKHELSELVTVVETQKMSPLELACVRGNHQILAYYVND